MFEVKKAFHFSAAHALTEMPLGHPCRQLHGHNYVVEVCVRKQKTNAQGMVIDFTEIDEAVAPYIRELDHTYLNDRFNFPTTSEQLARWLFECLEAIGLEGIHSVSISETPKTKATFWG